MADKQGRGRKLPAWYLDAVNMASEVFADAPPGVVQSRPHIKPIGNTGQGVSAQRQAGVGAHHKVATRQWLATQSTPELTEGQPPRRNGLRPPPPSTPLWTPPDADADTPDKRTPVQLDVDVVREIDNGR